MSLPETRANLEPPSEADLLKHSAQKDIEAILALTRLPQFEAYLLRRIREKIKPLREQLLTKALDHETYRRTQEKMWAYEEVLGMVDEDLATNQAILKR